MRPETEDALEELRDLFPLREGCAEAFDLAVAKVAVIADPEAIPALLDLADDECELGGLMYSLMDSLEVYPPHEYVPRFLAALPGFARRNPHLANKAVATLLWSVTSFDVATHMAPTLPPEVKRALRNVLSGVRAPEQERDHLLALL